MTDIDALNARIETLEVRSAYQDQTIEALNATITEQWKRIDDLSRQLARLSDRLDLAEASDQTAPQEKPPHY